MKIHTLAFALALAAPPPAQGPQTEKPAAGCTVCDLVSIDGNSKSTLKIRWKRRVDSNGVTVSEHKGTEAALDEAVVSLKNALAPLGVEVQIQKAALRPMQFARNPLNSNRLWLNGAAITMYLPNSKVGSVKDPRSGTMLRTIDFAGESFRDVPAELIVSAGLIAAAESIKDRLAELHKLGVASAAKKRSCCGPGPATATKPGCPPTPRNQKGPDKKRKPDGEAMEHP